MVETKFTPGPWWIAGDGTIRAGDGWVGTLNWRNRRANAALSAAAPDLYAALETLLFDAFEDAHPDSVKAARNALAKARGEPHAG